MNYPPSAPSTSHTDESEAERIAAVYGEYAAARAGRERWSGSNRGNRAMSAERRRRVQRALQDCRMLPLAGRDILEVGCGSGGILRMMRDQFGADEARMIGVDIRSEAIETARVALPRARLHCVAGEEFPVSAASVDVALTFTLFSSILDERVAGAVAASIERALRPGGLLVCYDMRHQNPFNRNVRPVTVRALARWFPSCSRVSSRSLTLLPPLARRLGALTSWLYPLLAAVPLLRTHRLTVLRRTEQR